MLENLPPCAKSTPNIPENFHPVQKSTPDKLKNLPPCAKNHSWYAKELANLFYIWKIHINLMNQNCYGHNKPTEHAPKHTYNVNILLKFGKWIPTKWTLASLWACATSWISIAPPSSPVAYDLSGSSASLAQVNRRATRPSCKRQDGVNVRGWGTQQICCCGTVAHLNWYTMLQRKGLCPNVCVQMGSV